MPINVPNAQMLDLNGQTVSPIEHEANDNNPLDRDWMKVAFMISDDDLDDVTDIKNRYWSSASAKFVDTRLGCNIGINPRPQWTRYSDIRAKGRFADREDVSIGKVTGNHGLGRAYSEGIDEPAQRIYMRFGVPAFNGLGVFLMRAFDREQTIMARTGRAPTAWYNLFKTVGMALTTIAFPMLSITVGVGKAVSWMMGQQTSKFFTLKPTMYLYWNTVQSLVINHSVNYGIIPLVAADEKSQRLGRPYQLDEKQIEVISALMPDVFGKTGTFDILSMATRAQRLSNAIFVKEYENLGKDSASDSAGYLKKIYTGNESHGTYLSTPESEHTLSAMLNRMIMIGDYFHSDSSEETAKKQELDPRLDLGQPAEPGGERTAPYDDSRIEAMKKYADAEFKDGSEFAIFRVDYTGSMSESFSNSVGESDLAQKFNGISSQFREARFSLADGNIVGGMIDKVTNAITNIGMGLLDGVTLGFSGLVPGLGGAGYIDIPKHWQSSSASLPRGSYTIQLISPYNNPVSRMINIWIPFYMLLAGAMPRSTGKSSYTSPFYCQIFDRGRLQARTAMIESLSVVRGTSNQGFDINGQALAIDISLNVVDLSSIMHMPVSMGPGELDITMDEDNITQDYLAVLAGMDIYSQIYKLPKAQLKMTKELAKMKYAINSPAFHVAAFKNSLENGFINDLTFGLSSGIVNVIEGASRGSASLGSVSGEN